MAVQPDLTTRLVKHPRATSRKRTRQAGAAAARAIALRCWWAAYTVLVLGVVLAVMWSDGTPPVRESLGDVIAIVFATAALGLVIVSVVVAVMLGEARADDPALEQSRTRRVQPAALQCWFASLLLTVFGVVAALAWNETGPPYDDSVGEIVWFYWIVGAWCLLLFSAVIAGKLGEARAQPALRARAAEVSELRASRGRLVDASDAARRGIERDLHDGVQPRLVALLLNVSMARRDGVFDSTATAIDDIEHELRAILNEVRALASGILPPALTDLGLSAAVTDLTARMPFAVDLAVPEQRMPARAETTAYFVIAEALTNAAKHADPSRVSVRVIVRGKRVTVEVHDDGRGGADADGGKGLLGLADRVDTLDGSLRVASSADDGTTITAEFSCAS